MSNYYLEDCYTEDEDKFNLREWMDEFNRIRELNKSMYEYPAGWGDLIASNEQQECALSEATLGEPKILGCHTKYGSTLLLKIVTHGIIK